MVLFTVLILAELVFSKGPIGYTQWASMFSPQWMKALTFTVILALLYHVWVGMRNIFQDYVHPYGVRFVLDVFAIVWLVACSGWAIQVLWRL
jgi:succinate dehydrogenase / fumarate reductase membrane anchor subunit